MLIPRKSSQSQGFRPELLAPAGNFDKFKMAVAYGADAAYLGGQKFGLRTAADNFTETQLEQAVSFARPYGARVYVTLNGFLLNKDLKEVKDFAGFLSEIGVHAVIVSDLGIVHLLHESFPNFNIHLSTQASCLNQYTAKFWKKAGVKRIVLGRETTISEGGRIGQAAGVEIEQFIHGSMCSAFSGHCTISNYTQGRDANRGGCAHSCRFKYKVTAEGQGVRDHFFMSSKDLNGVRSVPEFFKHRIHSLKIEGRMRSELYVATTVFAYRRAIDEYLKSLNESNENEEGTQSPSAADLIEEELNHFGHRAYHNGSLSKRQWEASVTNWDSSGDSTIDREGEAQGQHKLLGVVLSSNEKESLVSVKAKFLRGETVDVLSPGFQQTQRFRFDLINSFAGTPVDKTNPSTVIRVPFSLPEFSILRKIEASGQQ